jgi:hypothetical protein
MTRTAATTMLMIHRVQSMPRVASTPSADPADNGEPERNVVAVPRRKELAQPADDDAGDDHTDDVHSDPFHRLGTALFFGSAGAPSGRGLNPAWGSSHN